MAASLAVAPVLVLTSPPAGAALITTDAIGIRVDEAALATVLADLEQVLQPVVDAHILAGVDDPSGPFGASTDVSVESVLSLGIDILASPPGAIVLDVSVADIEVDYLMPAPGPPPDCHVYIRPADGTVEADAAVLPPPSATPPFAAATVAGTWDLVPGLATTGTCWSYLASWVPAWWVGLWGATGSVATAIEDDVAAALDDLLADTWDELVQPVGDSLEGLGFDVTIATVDTDAGGLIVTSDVDATGGVTIPGLGGPYNVSSAATSGATSNVFSVLADRDPLIVSIHPDVLNQVLDALHQGLSGAMGPVVADGPTTEDFLLPPANRASFADNGWTLSGVNTVAPQLDATGGVPLLDLPASTYRFFNSSYASGLAPVATFAGSVDGFDLVTEDRGAGWGPAFRAGMSTAPSLVRTTGIAPVVSWNPDPADMEPFAAGLVEDYGDSAPTLVATAPLTFRGAQVELCSTCPPPGDDRYTVSFAVV